VHEVLIRALEPVLADLRGSGAPVPELGDEDWGGNPEEFATAMMHSLDGTAIGVQVSLEAAEPDRIVEVAEQVQEWAIERLWGTTATNWPVCPNHPNTHPMTASVKDGVARWVCPRDGSPFPAIGALQ
jgi:hypothetical protein